MDVIVEHLNLMLEQDDLEFEQLELLHEEAEARAPFPIQYLGSHIEDAVNSIFINGIADMNTCAASVLSAVSCSVSPHVDTVIGNKRIPSTLWIMHMAPPAAGKSAAMSDAFAPFMRNESRRQQLFTKEKRDYESALPDEKPEDYPQNERRSYGDSTIASILRSLQYGNPAAYLKFDEGVLFTEGYDFSDKRRRLAASGVLSTLFSEGIAQYTRAQDRIDVLITGRRLGVCVFTQNASGIKWAKLKDLNDQGISARFLMSVAGDREAVWPETDIMDDKRYTSYCDRIQEWEWKDLPIDGWDRSDGRKDYSRSSLDPDILRPNESGSKAIQNHYDRWKMIANGTNPESPMYPCYLRAPEYALRIGAVLATYYDEPLSEKWINNSAKILDWHLEERKWILGEAVVSDEEATQDQEAGIVWQWMQERANRDANIPYLETRDLSRLGPGILRKKTTRDLVLSFLKGRGYIAPATLGKRKLILLNPEAY